MEDAVTQPTRKRMKADEKGKEAEETDSPIVEKEESEGNLIGSEEMELNIANIHEKIENFTQMVSELLDSGKKMFNDLSIEFEERLIMTHREQIEKWQEEIKELRSLDISNEKANALLNNARYVLQHTRID